MAKTANGEIMRYFSEVVLPYEGNECLPWPYGRNSKGYGFARIIARKGSGVHRLVCIATQGTPPSPEHQAAHRCGNRLCCNWRHIRWLTPSENQNERAAHGTSNRGERNPQRKLTEADVLAIKAQFTTSADWLAAQYGVSSSTIKDIRKGRRWAWLTSAIIAGEREAARNA